MFCACSITDLPEVMRLSTLLTRRPTVPAQRGSSAPWGLHRARVAGHPGLSRADACGTLACRRTGGHTLLRSLTGGTNAVSRARYDRGHGAGGAITPWSAATPGRSTVRRTPGADGRVPAGPRGRRGRCLGRARGRSFRRPDCQLDVVHQCVAGDNDVPAAGLFDKNGLVAGCVSGVGGRPPASADAPRAPRRAVPGSTTHCHTWSDRSRAAVSACWTR